MTAEISKKYPIRCIECGKNEVYPRRITFIINKNHDGVLHELSMNDVPASLCTSCRSVSYTEETDNKINESLREKVGLLTPQQIEAGLTSLGISHNDLADRLWGADGNGIYGNEVSMWIAGMVIQSKVMDNKIREIFQNGLNKP